MSSDVNLANAGAAYDPAYETTRVADEASFLRKLRTKRHLFRWVGEVYVGKRVKLAYFRDWLKALPLPARPNVLEVGSGDGLFSFVAAHALSTATVCGMELNAVEAAACQRIVEDERIPNLTFVAGLLDDFQWNQRYDFVFCLDVLEHIKEDVAALKQIRDAMKPGGSLLVHVPGRYFQDVDGAMRTISDEEAWRVNPGHVRNGYTPDELCSVLEQAGFAVERIQPTQGRPIARAHRFYKRFEGFLPARLVLLPLIDFLIWRDKANPPSHGNTLWARATRD